MRQPADHTKPFLNTLMGNRPETVPFWFMRQAGRYLPEYKNTRANAGSFLDLVYNPELAVEVTLQPIRRYHMSAAILFSDILVIPHALGQSVAFEEGRGPILEPVRNTQDLARLDPDHIHDILSPIYETVSGVATQLPSDVALIGFAGAPWTVATYMIEGSGSPDQAAAKAWMYSDPTGFSALIDMLVDASVAYLIRQVEAGAEALQIFDTWAGSLPEAAFRSYVIAPTAEIVRRVKALCPETPIIGFPRGAGPLYVDYMEKTGVDGVSIDTGLSTSWAAKKLQPLGVIQGNLDPRLLVLGGDAMLEEAERILRSLSGGPHIFNLGHGIVPEVPPENVAALSNYVRNWRAA